MVFALAGDSTINRFFAIIYMYKNAFFVFRNTENK